MSLDRIVGAATLILGLLYLLSARMIPTDGATDAVGPKTYPFFLGAILLALGAIQLLSAAGAKKDNPAPRHAPQAHSWMRAAVDEYGLAFAVMVWTALYIAVFEKLGFVISTTIYSLALMAYFNKHKWVANVCSSFGFSVIAYALLAKLLGANLPAGILTL
jgi:putative tricarboxylic transport membrane protein